MRFNLHDNVLAAELACQQSIETGESVYSVCPAGKQAVYIEGKMFRWGYVDDIEIVYHGDEATKWGEFLHGTEH